LTVSTTPTTVRIGRLPGGPGAENPLEAAEQQAGAGEEQQSESHFSHNQALAQAAAAPGGSGAFLQCILKVDRARLPGRREAKENAGENGHDDRESEHADVQRDLRGARNAVRTKREDQAQRAFRHKNTQRARD
jgi:hypothetical protein